MTIREFARLCGVSPATVSRYFSGQGSIREETRAQIGRVARETGYCPPAGYRTRRKNHAVIAVLLPNLQNTFFSDISEELRAQADRRDIKLVFLLMDEQRPENTLSMLRLISPVGIILLHESTHDPIADALSGRDIPVVVCGALAVGRRFSSVHIDDMMAAYDGINYLIGLGHRRIGVLSDSSLAISSGFQRITGCRKAMEDAGLELSETQMLQGGLTFEAGYSGARALFERECALTAVFAFSDDAALGAMAWLRDSGRRVPEDVSVLGFDDNSLAQKVRPRLTTIHQPLSLIAQKSIERLLDMQGKRDLAAFTLPYSLMERESCRPVRR